MGIKGLLQYLSNAQRDVHIGSFKGQTAAIDAYCWLHKGAYSCALQLVMKTEKCEKLPFIRYCMKRINLLRHHDITPIVVFDGARLPMKSKTEEERKERRQSYLEKGKALMKEGKQSEAVECFQRCVDVSPEMALAFIKVLRQEGVQVIVAPYEADAELAYLVKENIAHFVITEDSDLLAFGCSQVLFKMNDAGYGKLIELKDIGKANKSLIGFTPDSFRHMCILCGCDYLASIPGIGPSTACKLMRKFNKDPYKAIKSIKYESGKVPENYEEDFRRADHTFLYQLVFDPRTQQQVRLTTPSPDIDPRELEHAGFLNSPSKQVGLARGNINPLTMETMDSYSPAKHQDIAGKKSKSWSGSVLSKGPLTISRQTSLSIPVSDRAKKDFRPPKRSKVIEHDDDDLISSDELKLLYSNSTMKTTPSPPALSTVTETIASKNKFAIVNNEDTIIRSKYFIQNTSAESKEQTLQCCGSGSSSLAALDQIEEPSSSLDSGLGDSLPQDSSPYIKRKLFDLYSDSENKRVKLDDETGLEDQFKSELLDQSNQLDDQLKDLSSQSDDQLNRPNQLENLSNKLEDQSNQSTPSFEVVDLTNDFTDKRKMLQKSSKTIRLGLSKSSKTSFKPPRSSQHDNSPTLLSYFSYQQKEKLKH